MKYSPLILLFFVLGALSLSPTCQAETSPQKMMIILDASGSMWGQIKGQTKIEIAKEVIHTLAPDISKNAEVGFMAYGHRRKGDCKDIETLVALQTYNEPELLKAVDSLQPKGMTPLSASVREAADILKFSENPATVILISDGIETCDEDPCRLAQKLEATGVDFTTHVVGFDIKNEADGKQLRCLAENTGGNYYAADDAASLQQALSQAVEQVTPLVETPTPAAIPAPSIELFAVLKEGGEPLDSVRWEVSNDAGKLIKYTGNSSPKLELLPGLYTFKAVSKKGKAEASKTFKVENENQRLEVVLPAEGDIELIAVNKEDGNPLQDVYWEVKDSTGKAVTYTGASSPMLRLLPGTYQAFVSSKSGKAKASQEFEVEPLSKKTVSVLLAEEGILELIPVYREAGDPIQNVFWEVFAPAKTELSKPELITQGHGNTPSYTLLPGTYTVKGKSVHGKATVAFPCTDFPFAI